MSGNEGAGCRVLFVEDDMLIAVAIEEVLHALNCQVVGPVALLEKALKLAQGETFDVAILDVTIRGGKVYPVAELLLARGIPFVFASGYGDWALPEALRDQPRLMKAFHGRRIGRADQVDLQCSQSRRDTAMTCLPGNRDLHRNQLRLVISYYDGTWLDLPMVVAQQRQQCDPLRVPRRAASFARGVPA